MEAHGVLRQRGVERAVGGERQRGGVGHVRMQDAGLAGDAVDGGMDEHGGRLDLMAAGQLVAVGVDQDDVLGLDLVPHQAARVEQEMVGIAGQRDAEMVAHAFAQPVEGGRPQRERQVGAQRGDGFGVKERIGVAGFVVHGCLFGGG